ncbi:MAG: RHS repeat domain-containing protein [Polyangiaceae bacterium]
MTPRRRARNEHGLEVDERSEAGRAPPQDGLTTTVERDNTGVPIAIVAPFGQRTTLSLDTDGRLAQIADPSAATWQAQYQSDGLMTSWTSRTGHTTTFDWDAGGRLIAHTNPAGGELTFSRVTNGTAQTVTQTTPLGRTKQYTLARTPTGAEDRSLTAPSGLVTTTSRRADNQLTLTAPDGTRIVRQTKPDPRFAMQAP